MAEALLGYDTFIPRSLSMWAAVSYFGTASAANAALLWLQTFYVKQSPSFTILTYRFLQTCLSSLLFTISLVIAVGPSIGYLLKRRTSSRKEKILSWIEQQNIERDKVLDHAKPDNDWRGIIGFFHPFWSVCNQS